MREMSAGDTTGVLYYLHSDHLGSTSAATCGVPTGCGAAGGYQSVVSQQWYLPYGTVRHPINTMPTQRTYTGQYTEAPGLGSLMFYNARYYSPALGRFVSADSIVPGAGNPQALNRFAYGLSNPLKYIDPSGHFVQNPCAGKPDCGQDNDNGGGFFMPGKKVIPQPKIPEPTFDYGCATSGSGVCLQQGDDPIDALTHVLFGEGGSIGDQIAANVLQTILNRARLYWDCWKLSGCTVAAHKAINAQSQIPWEKITSQQLLALLLYIVSEPYVGGDGNLYASYNAWGDDYPHPSKGPGSQQWANQYAAVQNLIDSRGQGAIRVGNAIPALAVQSSGVLYYAVRPSTDRPGNAVYGDNYRVSGTICTQWYTTDAVQNATCP